jgi:AraC-like DNA-binding protein
MPTSFNSWTVVFLIASAQGFFVALVLWRWKRGNHQGKQLLAALVALFALSMWEYVLYWTNHLYQWPHFANLSINFTFLYGPLIWLYLRTIYEQKPLSARDLWHFLPYLIASLPFIPWYLADASVKQQVIANQISFPWAVWAIRAQFWMRMIHLVGLVGWNVWYVSRQPKVGDTTRWATLLCTSHVVFALAYIAYFVLIRFPFFNLLWDYHISAVMTVMIYMIAYAGYVQPAVFDGYHWDEPTAPAKYKHSGLTTDASKSLLKNLLQLMEETGLYRDADISLDKLSATLQASKHHVSQVINEHLGMSFFEYINHLRVNEARQLLAETTRHDLHVIEVAYAVGFNNKVSFNAAFKKETGMTPTEYRRHHAASDGSMPHPAEGM